MAKNGEKKLNQGNEFDVLLTDLSKAFDCLPHDLTVAKLHPYNFLIESVKILNSYLTKRKQMVKMINESHGWIS